MAQHPGTQPTILVVDDVALFRELEAQCLATSGRVITAETGGEALAALRREPADLVLLDLHLPDIDGIEICRAMKSNPALRHIPVVAVTGSDGGEDHARAVQAGADDVLAKPLERRMLIATAKRFLGEDAPRGLPRLDLDWPVRMQLGQYETWGTVRNVSRGGMFIESNRTLPRETRMRLEFQLPETQQAVSPTAKVVWSRRAFHDTPGGIGVRFLDLDGSTARSLELYVDDHRDPRTAPAPAEPTRGQEAAA